MSRLKKLLIGSTVLLIILCSLFLFLKLEAQNNTSLKTNVASLPKEAPATPTLQLKPGLLPPTNKWFSSLVFSTANQPIYAYPLSFAPTPNGFSFGVPTVVNSSSAIFGSHNPDVVVTMGGTKHLVEAYDDDSVEMATQNNQNVTIAETRISHGSPYIFSTFSTTDKVSIDSLGTIKQYDANGYEITLGDKMYGVASDKGLSLGPTGLTYTSSPGSVLSLFAIPSNGNQQTFFMDAAHPITGTSVTYQTTPTTITTNYHYQTSGGSTIFADLPTMHLKGTPMAGTFDTILGVQQLYQGNNFTDTEPAPSMPSSQLTLNKISSSERQTLISDITADTETLNFTQTDTYFGGKELYRAAQLLQLAEQLHQTSDANIIKTKLASRLSEWLTPNDSLSRNTLYFYYDTEYKGIVGKQPSYGSDQFNDHQFHYGYFIYAAAILGSYDHTFLTQYETAVNTLVADIASPVQTSYFPKMRVFDPYVGHSWASGNGDFADGNNQESSSEAINAWYATYLWSTMTNNTSLKSEAIWLYAHETTAANANWLSIPKNNGSGPAYDYPYAGMVWGDKLAYATFFNAQPAAVLGIQLIPMSPGQAYLADNKSAITSNLSATVPEASDYNVQYGDYLLMYEALANPKAALKNLSQLAPQNIDNGDSLSYVTAWVYSHQN